MARNNIIPWLKHAAPYRGYVMIMHMVPLIYSFWLINLFRDRWSDEKTQSETANLHNRVAQAVHDIAEKLEGITIKIAQIAGARGAILPPVYAEVLGRFHDAVDPHPFETVRPLIEGAIGGTVEDVFAQFEPEAIAAASLAQVHKAVLKDGRIVAVKIQYPEADRLIQTDTRIIRFLSKLASRVAGFDVTPFASDLTEQLTLELDYEREANAMRRVKAMFADNPQIEVPAPIDEMVADKVLVMTWLEGMPLTDRAGLAETTFDKNALADLIGQAYVRMIFDEEFFHGDPHPGNIRITPEGKIGILDFGLSRELPKGFGNGLGLLIGSSLSDNLEQAKRGAAMAGITGDEDHIKGLMHAMKELVSGSLAARLSDSAHNATPTDRMEIRPGISIPPHITLVFRAFSLLDGLSARLTPGERRVQQALIGAIMQSIATATQSDALETATP